MHKALEDHYAEDDDVVLFHVQTVFEGASSNTPERGPREAKSHGITAPVGYDARVDGSRVSEIMHRYGTGGTPWTIVIDKKGIVRFSGFTAERAETLITLIDKLREE